MLCKIHISIDFIIYTAQKMHCKKTMNYIVFEQFYKEYINM